MSRVNVDVNFTVCHRDSTTDNDKLRNRSKNWGTIGYPRMKGLKSHGNILNVICQSPTELFVSCDAIKFGKNTSESARILL